MIEVVPETGSTNADLARRLGAGEAVPDGFWLRAIRQNGGKGRRGREWIAPEGNLTCSTVVNLRAGDPPVHTLAFVAALAVHDVVAAELPGDRAAPVLKWPNDVLVDGAKICGVLLELCGQCVVAGIGVNVAEAPDIAGRATTALHAHGSKGDAVGILERLTSRFAHRLRQWRADGLGAVLADWQRRACPLGTLMRVALDEEESLVGAYAGLDSDGALRLRLGDGSLRVVHAGDVSLI